jgi:hypothetical protein
MKFSAVFRRQLHWLNLPGTLLIALLQRTPVVRVVASAGDYILTTPVSAVLKAAATTLGALGAVHSMAGATTLSANPSSPTTATVGVAKTIVITIAGAESAPASFTVGGSVPPGMTFAPLGNSSGGITSGTINASTLQLSGTPTAPGQYSATLKGWEGPNATLTNSANFSYVITVAAAANTAPTITTQPSNATVSVGGTVLLSAAAAGSPAPTFQWNKAGIAISGATSSTFVVSGATAADAGSYTMVATNSLGSAISNAATLTVTGVVVSLPVFVTSPTSATVAAGGSALLVVSASNSPTYQWRKNGVTITGATNATLNLTALATSDTGNYDVVATNSAGTATSAAANLIVTGPLTARLSNLSVRTTLTANQILTVGLTMSGGSGNVLLRAAGPGLGALGVPGTMADPKLTLFNGTAPLLANDNWGDTSANATAVIVANSAVGAFALPVGSLDAALVAAVDGGRTVQVSGPTAGNVIVEAYDTGSTNSPRLTNLSALNQVGTGGDVLIAGFTVAGSGTKNLLIRAVGPSLAAFGVVGTLTDPKLVVRRSSDQTIVGENDNYAASLSTVFSSVGAFQLVPGAKDATLIVSLPASAGGTGYTVTVSGSDGGTGVAIVEVYELP